MQVNIEYEEVVAEYQKQIASMSHDLIVAKLSLKKMQEQGDKLERELSAYKQAEEARTRSAAAARAEVGRGRDLSEFTDQELSSAP